MRSFRYLAIRLVLGAATALLLCVIIYFGLGWAVWRREPWLIRVLGKPAFDRWVIRYANTAAALAPGDDDGDGVCNGLEWFYRTDPNNASQHPSLTIANTNGDGAAMAFAPNGDLGITLDHMLLVSSGAKLRAHCSLLIAHQRHPFPSGFQVRILPSAQTAIALPNGTPAVAPLKVHVSPNGEVCFDLQLLPWALNTPRLGETLLFTNVAGTEMYGTLRTLCIWPEPALSPSIRSSPVNGKKYTALHLTWPSVPESAEAILLEAARNDEKKIWNPLRIYPGPIQSADVYQHNEGLFIPRLDPLQFRVVPIHFAPP